MNAVGNMITWFFNLILLPFGTTHHLLALVTLSVVTGVIAAFVFKWVSNPAAIRVAKDLIKARILEMRIYQDDPALILKGFGGTLKSNFVYLRVLLKPIVVLMIPLLVVWMQMDERFSRRPLDEGAQTLLSVQLKDGLDPFGTDVTLGTNGGVIADSRPVRIADTREIGWRLRVESPGTADVTLSVGDEAYTFPIVAEPSYRMIGHQKNASSWIEPLLHPALPAIPSGSPFSRVELTYPSASYPLLFWDVPWWAIFIVYLSLAAIALKFVIKFEI
jgi:hypothetical protein